MSFNQSLCVRCLMQNQTKPNQKIPQHPEVSIYILAEKHFKKIENPSFRSLDL